MFINFFNIIFFFNFQIMTFVGEEKKGLLDLN